MNRRQALKLGGLAGVGALTMGVQRCGGPNLSFYVSTIIGAMKDLSPLLPNLSANITKAIKVAETFDAAYRKGDFDSAEKLFENLNSLISQIADDAGIESQQVKLAITFANVGIRAIAAILFAQRDQPAVASAIAKRGAAGKARLSVVERLADAAAIDKAYQASKL